MQGTQDVLLLCLRDLGAETFFGLLRSSVTALQGGYRQITHPPSCIALEAAVSILVIVAEEIKTSWQVLITSSPSTTSMAGCSAATIPPVHLTFDLLDYILSHPLRNDFPSFVLYTSCQFVGAATFMLSADQDLSRHSFGGMDAVAMSRNLYEPALTFLFDAFSASTCTPAVSVAAANSLLRLCTHGEARLTLSHESEETNRLLVMVAARTASIVSAPRQETNPWSGYLHVLLQATCQVISNVQTPQHANSALSMIGDSIRVHLMEEVAAPQWSAHRMVDVLGLLSQAIRYSRPTTLPGPSSGALADFIASVWEYLYNIGDICLDETTPAHVASSVLDAVFAVYENAAVALPDMCTNEEVLISIVDRCVDGFGCRHVASAMKCAAALVNVICCRLGQDENDARAGEGMLSILLLRVLGLMNESVVQTGVYDTGVVREGSWVWGDEPESVEQLYIFLYQYFSQCPHVMVHVCQSPIDADSDTERTLAHVLNELSLICLGQAKERDVIRRVLLVLQAMWCPLVGGNQDLFDTASYIQGLCVPSLGYAESLLQYIARSLDGQLQRDLWPSLTDMLYTLITASCDNGVLEQMEAWIEDVFLKDPYVFSNIAESERCVMVHALLGFARNRDLRHFRVLVSDIGKVCSNELDSAALQDHVL